MTAASKSPGYSTETSWHPENLQNYIPLFVVWWDFGKLRIQKYWFVISFLGICNKKFIFFLKALPKSHWEFCCFKYMSENATNSENIIRSLNVLWRVLSLNSILCILQFIFLCKILQRKNISCFHDLNNFL